MKLNVSFIKSVLTVYDELLNNGISLVYLGEFNQEITRMFTSMAEEDMDKNNEQTKIKRKVYHVMVETLQNMSKHSDELANLNEVGRGLFMIGRKEDSYYIITSNKIHIDKKESLNGALVKVNLATNEELKEMYKKQIKEGSLSDKGGAGLGLIDIARKTNERLDYHFIPYDDNYYFFILKVEINGKKLQQKIKAELNNQEQSDLPPEEE
ncbi:MAG: hypothetical protein EAZ55_11540 [Cytophagales bacterium]|nr:MAG: hypothetical protein EAZ55_11540 [Cytophagales bacterium]